MDLDEPFYDIPEPQPLAEDLLESAQPDSPDNNDLSTSPVDPANSDLSSNANSSSTVEALLKQRAPQSSTAAEEKGSKSPPAPPKIDPLAAMREKMKQQQQSYTVARKEPVVAAAANPPRPPNMSSSLIPPPTSGGGTTPAVSSTAGVKISPATANFLPPPTDKEMQDMMGKKWSVWAKDENVCVYICLKNKRNNLFRFDLRLEKTVKDVGVKIGNIRLRTTCGAAGAAGESGPAGGGEVTFALGGAGGKEQTTNEFPLVQGGFLDDRSGKIKAMLDVSKLSVGFEASLGFELVYDEERPASSSSSPMSSAEVMSAKVGSRKIRTAFVAGITGRTIDDVVDIFDMIMSMSFHNIVQHEQAYEFCCLCDVCCFSSKESCSPSYSRSRDVVIRCCSVPILPSVSVR